MVSETTVFAGDTRFQQVVKNIEIFSKKKLFTLQRFI